MVSPALQRLRHHPTPWWSRYALTHPTVVRRTLRAHGGSDLLDNTLTACGLAGLAVTLVLGLTWFMALDPRFHERLPSMWVVALGFTGVVMPPVYGMMLNQLRYAYRTAMTEVQRRHHGAFLQVAEAWEAERFGKRFATLERTPSASTDDIVRLPQRAQRSNQEEA